jgi:hypothetical protein
VLSSHKQYTLFDRIRISENVWHVLPWSWNLAPSPLHKLLGSSVARERPSEKKVGGSKLGAALMRDERCRRLAIICMSDGPIQP